MNISDYINKTSVHSISKHYQGFACEISLLYSFKKPGIEELIQSNKKNSPPRTNKNSQNISKSIDSDTFC